MQVLSLSAEKRPEISKSARNSARRAGLIPAVVYGGDTVEHISVTHAAVKHLIYTPDFKLADLSLDGANHKCFIKNIQFHPVTDKIVHIDFLKLVEGTPVKVEVPVRFKGVSPGVKQGGSLVTLVRKVKIKAKPEDLVDELFIDISELELGFAVRVKDIEVSDKIEIMMTPATPVANVEVPRALRSAEDALEAEESTTAEGAEGEDAQAADGEKADA